MPGPIDPVTEMILKLLTSGNAGGLPMQPSRGLQGHLNARLRGFPAPQVNNVVPGPGSNPPISQDPWFDAPIESQLADEARLPPDQFKNAGDISPEDLITSGTRQIPPVGNGEFYIWSNKNGKKTRVDGPFTDQLQAMREFKLMQRQDPDLLARMGAYVGGPEGE